MTSHPYDDLTPERVLDALAEGGLWGDGRLLQLNSYENRVFQVFLEDGSAVVAKFYRPGRWSDAQILEEHAFAAELQAEEVPVVAPLTLSGSALGEPPTLLPVRSGHGLHRVAVSPRCAGREPELDEPGTLERIGQFLGRCHAVGARRPFLHRLSMEPARDARAARDALRAGPHLEPTVGARWAQVSDEACTAVASAFEAFAQHGPLRRLRLHGDAHRGNVLWRDGGPHVVDLDDAVQGPAIQDLWMLVSGKAIAGSSTSTNASWRCWSRCARCACCATAPGWRRAGRTRRSRGPFPASARPPTGKSRSRNCRSSSS